MSTNLGSIYSAFSKVGHGGQIILAAGQIVALLYDGLGKIDPPLLR